MCGFAHQPTSALLARAGVLGSLQPGPGGSIFLCPYPQRETLAAGVHGDRCRGASGISR